MNRIQIQMCLQKKNFFTTRKKFNHTRQHMIDTLTSMFPENPGHYISEAFGGGIKSYDAVIMHDVLNIFKPKSILEVGSYLGQSSRWILECTKSWNAELTCVDPNIHHRAFEEPRQVFEIFALKNNEDRLQYHEAFFADEPLENELTRIYPHKAKFWAPKENTQFDFMFIDAGHSYEDIKHDFELALNFIKPGGVMMFHDTYSWEGVGQLMDEIGAMTFVPFWYKVAQSKFNSKGYYLDGIGIYVHPQK